MYGVVPYFVAKDIVQLPLNILLPFLFSLLYFGIGENITIPQFLIFFMVNMMIGFATTAYGQVIGTIFDSSETACYFAPILMMPFVLFSGFFTNVESFPKWIGWVQYISPVRYGLECAVRNEFEGYKMQLFIPNPITYLNFKLGMPLCIIMLFVTTYGLKVLACFCLKFLIKKFQ